jgi:signal recognition particle receptor subunit beta
MAVIDPQSGAVVIRIAYDGAPMAGKTTSVRALGRGLNSPVITPAEVSGRTLYFDWLDYTGGWFEGHRIRCQIVSVPGQASLASRRRRLLEQADVVVYVGDSTRAGFEADQVHLKDLCGLLATRESPPVGLILQANKRDQPDAVPLEKIRDLLEQLGLNVGVMESVATDNQGVRETFVFAVRLALDRVGELMREGRLLTAQPDCNDAGELLAQIRGGEGQGEGESNIDQVFKTEHSRSVAGDSLMSEALAEVVGEQLADTVVAEKFDPQAPPRTPDGRVPSGLVWPPVDGRLILNELSGASVQLHQSPRGDWYGSANNRWRLLSPADARYEDVEDGRVFLMNSARAQAARSPGTVVDRCVVLAPDGAGRYRLWNVDRLASSAGEARAAAG